MSVTALSPDLILTNGTVLTADQVQHHIQGRNAAGAREPIAVYLIDVGGCFNLWEFLNKPADIFPVNGTAAIVQQSSFGQDMRAGAKGSNSRSLTRHAPEKPNRALVDMIMDIDPGDHADNLGPVRVPD